MYEKGRNYNMDNRKELYLQHAKSNEYEVCIWGAGFLGTGKGLQILKKRKISVDYYCDNNSKLWGKEVIDGIRCISPDELQKKKGRVVCFLMMTNMYAETVLIQLNDMGIKEVVVFDDLFIEEKEEYFPFMKKNHIAFYTCIVGDYDDLMEPLTVRPDCDYYVISDKKPQQKTIFQYIDINEYLPKHITDNTKKNRYCKMNAHKIFPQYKYSVYFDGEMQMDSSIVECIQELPKTRITTLCNNYWNSSYMEAMRVILMKRDAEDVVVNQMEHYWLEGFPEDFGNVYCTILLREHNHPVCRKLMEDWWDQVDKYSRRDQISFPYVLWKNGFAMADVKTLADKFEADGKYWKCRNVHKQPRLVYERGVVW